MPVREAPKPNADVFAVLRLESARWMGRLMSDAQGGQPRLAFDAQHAPADMPLGTMLTIGIATRSMGRPAQSRAKLVATERAEDQVILEVQPDDPTLWAEVIPHRPSQGVNRRSWPRLAVAAADESVIQVVIDAGPPSGRRLAATVLDVSDGGVGLRFGAHAEPRLCKTKRMVCFVDEHPRVCSVRHRRLVPLGVRYGVAYLDEVPDEEPKFEAHWVCATCGTTPLLADAHLHCPACGTPRDDGPTHLPDWDSLISTEAHPFNGVARSCLRCGSGWAMDARNCGHCGTRLPSWDT